MLLEQKSPPNLNSSIFICIFSSMCFMLFSEVRFVCCRFVFAEHRESGHSRGLSCGIWYRHWEGWTAFSVDGISTLDAYTLRKLTIKKRLCWCPYFFLLSQKLQETITWYIMAKKVKGCVCFGDGSTTKAMRGCDTFSLASSRNEQCCSLKPPWGVTHSKPRDYLIYCLTPWSKTNLLGWCCFTPSEAL